MHRSDSLPVDLLRKGRLLVGTAFTTAVLAGFAAVHAAVRGQTAAAYVVAFGAVALAANPIATRRGAPVPAVAAMVLAELFYVLSHLSFA